MSDGRMSIAEIVARIEAGHVRVVAAIAPLSDRQMQEALTPGGWSVKDELAHLAFWDNRLLHAVEPVGGPGVNRRVPPEIADIRWDDAWLETVNWRVYERNRDRSLADVRAEFDATRARLLRVVGGLSEHAVYDEDGLSDGLGEPFAPMLLGAFEHYEEHAETLEAQGW